MRTIGAIILLTLPTSASAEVWDKVPSTPEVFLLGVGFAFVAFALASWRWWLSVMGLLLAALLIVGASDLFGFNGLREALWLEMGFTYFLNIGVTAMLIVVASVVGGFRAWRKHEV